MPNLPRLLVAALLMIPLLTAGAVTTPGATTGRPTFVVAGRVGEPVTLTVDDLRNFPVQRQKVRFVSGTGQQTHRYQGALLAFEEDGRALERPRLVVPGDAHGGRYVTDVSTVSLLRVGA